jgi:hypothetical protein
MKKQTIITLIDGATQSIMILHDRRLLLTRPLLNQGLLVGYIVVYRVFDLTDTLLMQVYESIQ